MREFGAALEHRCSDMKHVECMERLLGCYLQHQPDFAERPLQGPQSNYYQRWLWVGHGNCPRTSTASLDGDVNDRESDVTIP